MTAWSRDAELARAKAQLKSGLLMGLERPGTRAEQIAGQIFTFGRVQSAAEIVAQIDARGRRGLKRYAARVIGQPIDRRDRAGRQTRTVTTSSPRRFARAPEAAE